MSPQSQILSLVGWAFIPTFLTHLIQLTYHAFRYGSKSPHLPRRGSVRFSTDFNRILMTIVLVYLCSLVFQGVRSMEPNHYDTLGLNFGAFTQKQLKTNFRKASLQYHPDKVGQAGADTFVKIRAAHEVLVDPTLRTAYDRFGLTTTQKCTTCKTNKDYLHEGFKQFYTFYVGAVTVLCLFNLVGKGSYGRVTFEHIEILHQLYISVSVAFLQVGPLLFSSKALAKQQTAADLMKRLQALSEISAAETLIQVKSWMDTLVSQDECVIRLRRELGYMSLEMKLGQDDIFFDTRCAIKARIERQGELDRKNEKLEDLD
ncbi:hypothetical protein BGX23_006481 [Mortierella sp. AD031]|nr:hypothetical protein BGX23_006481 [Mortierella sp. AD031]